MQWKPSGTNLHVRKNGTSKAHDFYINSKSTVKISKVLQSLRFQQWKVAIESNFEIIVQKSGFAAPNFTAIFSAWSAGYREMSTAKLTSTRFYWFNGKINHIPPQNMHTENQSDSFAHRPALMQLVCRNPANSMQLAPAGHWFQASRTLRGISGRSSVIFISIFSERGAENLAAVYTQLDTNDNNLTYSVKGRQCGQASRTSIQRGFVFDKRQENKRVDTAS